MQAVLDYIYEAFYSGRILGGVFVFAHFLLERRRRSRLPAAAMYLVTVLVSSCFNILVRFLQQQGWQMPAMRVLHFFWYSALLLVLFGVFVACYRGTLAEYLYVFTCGLLVECSVFGLFRLFYDMGVVQLRVNTPFSILFEAFFSLALYTCVFIFFRRLYRRTGKLALRRRRALIVYFVFVVALIMFLRFNLQAVYEVVYRTENGWIISLTLGLIPVALLVLVTGSVRVENLADEARVLGGMLAEKERQYRLSAETIDIINRKCHDIKRQLRALRFKDEGEGEEIVRGIEQDVTIYDAASETGNPALNTILSEKRLYCAAHGISLTCTADGAALSFLDPVDIYVLFGNLLDNAIEAVERLEDAEKRVISLTACTRGGFLLVRTDNYFSGGLRLEDGLPQTSKENKAYHGFGVRSIRHIAEKYGGAFSVEAEEDVFVALVSVPLPGGQGETETD